MWRVKRLESITDSTPGLFYITKTKPGEGNSGAGHAARGYLPPRFLEFYKGVWGCRHEVSFEGNSDSAILISKINFGGSWQL